MSFVQTIAPTPDGGTVVVGFGPSAATLSPDDAGPVARAIEVNNLTAYADGTVAVLLKRPLGD